MLNILSKIYLHFKNDSLYRNSIYLMLSTGVMAVLGFGFWAINARLYTPEEIGLATALISLTNIITGFSILGLNTGVIRYLPTSDQKNSFISSVFIIVGSTTFVLTTFYMIFLNYFSPKLLFIRDDLFLLMFIIAFITLAAIQLVSESIFIAYRSTKYVLIYNTLYSISKLALPVLLITFGAVGIYLSYSIGILIALAIILYFLIKKFKFTPKMSIDKNIIRKIGKFSFASYSASFIGGLPVMLFPLIILNQLGAEVSAYYYMDMMILNLLNIIPIAISQSLFAESSYNEDQLKEQIKKSVKLTSLILIPAIILTIVLGKYVLLFFGKEFSTEGVGFLNIMALSTLLIPINYTYGVILRIKHKVKEINIAVSLGTIVTLLVSYFMISQGLIGVGIGLISGNAVVAIFYTTLIIYYKIKNKPLLSGNMNTLGLEQAKVSDQ